MLYDEEMTANTAQLYYEEELDEVRELENLSALLQKTQEKLIGHWLGSNFHRQLNDSTTRHQQNLGKLTEKVEKLNSELDQLRQERERRQKAGNDLTRELEVTRGKLEVIHDETDKLLLEKERMERHIKNVQEELVKQRQAVENKSQSTEECSRELGQSLQFFTTRLGLKLKKISGERIQFVFTNIDDKEPTRPFCFCVWINADKTYTISDVQPDVQGLADLTDKLESTNNFRSFVVSMRRKFQTLLS